MEIETGRPMGNPGEAMPADSDIDTLLNGGTANQENIPLEDAPPKDVDHSKAIDTEEAPAPEIAPGLDPIVAKLQEAIAGLTPEQRAVLTPPAEINVRGEKINVPADKQVALMQMGADYSDKMRALNVERQTFQQEKDSVAQQAKYYGDIEKVAKENPEWWDHVKASYQARISGNTGNGAANPTDSEMPPPLRAALSQINDLQRKLDGFLETQTKEATTKQQQTEDTELEQQIQSFSKEHSEFDWLTADKSGLVLADRITVHAHKNGINNFRAAARDYLFSDLIARKQVDAKEQIKKDIQNQTKSGVVNSKSKPNGLTAPKNFQTRDYSDLMMEGLKELG